ncbi:MAG: PmoA family protein [Verrucomicrobiales bacterium]|nr:PmoA family protein [Verrucomicrobiales bacterium]
MGHPGASNHEHHRSIWFAHHDVDGHDFWSDNSGTQIVEKMWLAYNDGPDECIMATLLEWKNGKRLPVTEGITFFDHPDNPSFPCHWHVREDGWIGASLCMHEALDIKKNAPLKLRYLLHAHTGPVDADHAQQQAKNFAQRPGFTVAKGKAKHHQFEVKRDQ